jgi:hypothetical protein
MTLMSTTLVRLQSLIRFLCRHRKRKTLTVLCFISLPTFLGATAASVLSSNLILSERACFVSSPRGDLLVFVCLRRTMCVNHIHCVLSHSISRTDQADTNHTIAFVAQ